MNTEQEKQIILMGLTLCQLKISLSEINKQMSDLEKEYTIFTQEVMKNEP